MDAMCCLSVSGLSLLCDVCDGLKGCPTDEEIEAMLLAADEEQAERDAYYAAHGLGCEWEVREL